ncbi:MAG: DUF4145 domain-containing protein [Desulfobacteraceae bacterium]|nr:MAG: DUF4145 domain-containing protein [Desulfobacteraceae bacterium]
MTTDIYFLEQIREFQRLEKEFIKLTYEAKKPAGKEESSQFMNIAIELAFGAIEKRNEILGEMHDVSEIQIIDPEARNIIDKLRKKVNFETLNFAENLAAIINKNIDTDSKKVRIEIEEYFNDNFDELWDDFFSWFYIPSYYARKAQVGAIITSSKLPHNVIVYFEEIKEAFAFGLDKAGISLSRALLELALREKLRSKGYFIKSSNKRMSNVINLSEEDPLTRFISVARNSKLLSDGHKKLANEIRERGNNVLHIKEIPGYSFRGLALKTIKDTVEIIEYLYR